MKKRFLSILTALTLCLTLLPTAAFAAATTPDVWDGDTAAKLTGSGTSEDDPFLISTGAELKLLAENSRILDFGSRYVKLTNEEDVKNMEKLLDMLEDNEDVQNTYHNWETED